MPDWKTDLTGDLVLAKGQVAVTADESETAKQNILFRLQTGLFSYEPEPEIGAGLDELVGRPNRAETGSEVRRAVAMALTRDAAFPASSIYVEVVPLSHHSLGIYVFHQPRFAGSGDPVTVSVSFNLTTGLISLLDGDVR